MSTHNSGECSTSQRMRRWLIPALVFASGLLLLCFYVSLRSSAAEALAAERFAGEAERMENRLSSEISARMTEFDVGVDFVSSRPSVDADELHAFFDRRTQLDYGLSEDIGFLVLQSILATELDAFIEESRVDRPQFEVFNPVPDDAEERLIITYVEHDVPVFGRSFVGFDITAVHKSFLPADLTDAEAIYAQVTPAEEYVLVGFGQPFQSPTDFEPAVVLLMAPFSSAGGGDHGFAVKVISVQSLIESVEADLVPELTLAAKLSDSELPAAFIDRRSTLDTARSARLEVSGTSRREAVDLDPLTITLTASSHYERPSFAASWLIGIFFCVLAASAVFWRRRQSTRLAQAALDVEIAKALSETDPLTGVLNRQGIRAALENANRSTGTVLFIDLDRFKSINDTDGHQRGDEVLRQFANVLQSLVRPFDLISRFGGDEFLVVLEWTSDDGRVDQLIRELQHRSRQIDERLSCSVGVSQLAAGDPRSFEEVIAEADQRMYENKRRLVSPG